ncbi:RNA polymerase sigma-70 factor (ECF subfamily) [Bacillus mesophilus]|uniref:Sigma-70 family RNA polymerase sigma factor n=1 Tax=Bacillus mesophilus TaxID=1808955 RepID=A0A6M0QBU0_9BACI|nr:sigma-70 family RNA polymerase sigma factor [Bacillus mesophilus]MBM7663175.1 RNA polymerase sigma-70 factor (ECF subfamily) [Bacillus mesophilus]NEY73851.1 sigma-70 family RNA polymerase sigma factor [Bacillus mesophilus]
MDVVQMVKKAKKRDQEAVLQLVMNQKDEYYRLAYTYMGNQHDAMDVMEEMIVILYEKIHQLNKEESFYSWSKTILVNRCKDILKKQNKLILMSEWDHHQVNRKEREQINADPYELSEQQMDINLLLENINNQQAEAIKLKYFHDLDYKTISKITNVSIGTVKSRIFQGLKRMKSLYGGDGVE